LELSLRVCAIGHSALFKKEEYQLLHSTPAFGGLFFGLFGPLWKFVAKLQKSGQSLIASIRICAEGV
jgi:hypothetical protein